MGKSCLGLLTDFGSRDYFIASLKGVILSINPDCTIVDISHEVPDYDLKAAAFILWACYRFFPRGSIFLTVVDPGVGSERRILLVRAGQHYFIAPDNGVLSLIYKEEEKVEVLEITGSKYYLTDRRTSFEGRDRMAPVAAWLSLGLPPSELGRPAASPRLLDLPEPIVKSREIQGQILYRDKFGNLITNLSQQLVAQFLDRNCGANPVVMAGKKKISEMAAAYSSAGSDRPFFIINSLGLLEIANFKKPAAEVLGLEPGDPVILKAD
ncbi:MAG: SAM-dependent chlorinase/fluorinase [Candidatus Aminicenantes bacterium]|nr:SAM-dependent chlorinase/fluorinase [Candidatus Aminicenantes bacterium]